MVITMFINHMYKDGILYLELDINYDFGNFELDNNTFLKEIKKYIDKTKLILKKKKIILTCGGIIIGSIILTNLNNLKEPSNIKYVPSFKNSITYVIEDNQNLENNNIDDKKEEIKEIQNTKKEESTSNNKQQSINSNNKSNSNANQYQSNSNSNNIKENNTNNVNNSNNIPQTNQTSSTNNSSNIVVTQPSGPVVTVHRSNGSVITIGLEEYIIGVLAAEMPASFNFEALKAQSVIARTYALNAKNKGKTLTDTVSTQAYIDIGQMQSKWGSSYNTYYNKIKNAVNATTGEYLTYNGSYIEAMYHSTNNGKTESSLDVFGNYYPYLVSVTSDYDKSASSYLRTTTMDINTISSKLGINLSSDSIIEILSYTDGSNIKQINIAGSTFTGRQVREALGLRSADFDIVINGNTANITTRGYGHGVGMSQYGANGMANVGYGYRNILSHYYPGTTLKK